MSALPGALRTLTILVVTSFALSCKASQSVKSYPGLVVHGENYKNICNPVEKKRSAL